jgi:hypothetical protein
MDAYETLKDVNMREYYHRLWDMEVRERGEEEEG